ncbi:uncharacterized protein LOC119020430 [Acanthopagrus latus]|uniref:uncharacterized protein LOC119020430 n=1 Tax=Acanthopagrus latus TaxID=8177 RepID=UPI00187CF87B|nr:uncharacterized protein LOC119020430 [Acanthopagrus latus]
MCSTSCPLTENPAAYIWYKNREFLYEDWSPWYQQLVSSEEAVTYSCAIKGYEDLRAPQVSVDSVTSACFSVTYAKGRMCSYVCASVDEPCSITYPTEVSIQSTPLVSHLSRVACTPSCPLTHNQTSYRWYRSKRLYKYSESRRITVDTLDVSCAVKGHEDLSAAGFCSNNNSCSRESYVSRRICAVEGSSVNVPSENFPYRQHECKRLFKMRRSGEDDAKEPAEDAGRLEYHDNTDGSCILRIKELRKGDSAEYTFRSLERHNRWEWSDYPGVTLVVTGLKVTFTPSAVVTEGQRVTLTCSTSCPLNTNYTWTFNSRPLNLPENQNNKQLVLDPLTSQHAGNYSCTVNSENNKMSPEATLTVLENSPSMAAINAVRLTVAPLIPIPLLVFHLWMRWTRP